MYQKYFVTLVIISFLLLSNIDAITLKKSVIEAVQTNPTIQEKLKNYRAAQQDLSVVESGYYPKLDLLSSFGYNKSSGLISEINNNNGYANYGASLILSHNIFNGFETTHKTKYEESKILSFAYDYLDTVNTITFKMTQAYIDVIRYDDQMKIALEDVRLNEEILQEVKHLYKSYKADTYDINKIQSALALAKSNLKFQINKANNAKYKYRTILGRMPELKDMQKINLQVEMPKDLQTAALHAINNNPSLLNYTYRIKMAQALKKQNEKGFYPKVDVIMAQNLYNGDDNNPYKSKNDSFNAQIVLQYRLYNGGKDKALSQKYISKINQEIEQQRAIKRAIVEDVDLSWNTYKMTQSQLNDLKNYKQFSFQTFKESRKKYTLAKMSILDLIMAQKDFINARLIFNNTKYDSIITQYKILNSMGILASVVVGQHHNFGEKVNLYTSKKAHTILDTEIVKLDVDNDNISDNKDLCDNSILQNNIMFYGCKKIENTQIKSMFKKQEAVQPRRIRMPKVYKKRTQKIQPKKRKFPENYNTTKDTSRTNYSITKLKKTDIKKSTAVKKQPIVKKKPVMYGDESFANDWKTPKKSTENINQNEIEPGSFMKENMINEASPVTPMYNSSFNSQSTPAFSNTFAPQASSGAHISSGCRNVPTDYQTDSNGCPKSTTISLPYKFEKSDTTLSVNMQKKISQLSSFLTQNPHLQVHIIGYSSKSNTSNYRYNLTLSKSRAKRFKNELIKLGISSSRITTNGKGFNNPIADNNTAKGRKLNRRVEITFSK